MRKYLFHGKKVDNGEWVEGYYVYDDSGQTTEEPAAYIHHLNTHPCGWCLIPYKVIPETVGQYTGLTDKNGTKIFEGDIILWGLAPCVAKYDTENARFMFYENGKYLKNGFNKDTMEMKEIIGNIHDNPELLKGGANNDQ